MYEWHLSEAEIAATSIFISRHQIVSKKVRFMEVLQRVSVQDIEKMQRAIEQVAFKLQYSVVPEPFRESSGDDVKAMTAGE